MFLAHGEPVGLEGLQGRLLAAGRAASTITIPQLDQTFDLTPTTAALREGYEARMIPGAAARPDWHNARASLLESLNERLQALPTDADRETLLAALAAIIPQSPEAQS